MLRRLIYLLSGERMLFSTTTPRMYGVGRVIDRDLGGGNKVLFRVSRVIKTKPVKPYNNSEQDCYEIWGREARGNPAYFQ